MSRILRTGTVVARTMRVAAIDQGTNTTRLLVGDVIDVGGGSTELIAEGRHLSTDIGSVRMTERFLQTDPPARDELERLAESIRETLDREAPADLRTANGIGVAGTITSLAALDVGL